MAGTFPTLSSGQVCMYPVTRIARTLTREFRFADGSRQGWMTQGHMNSFELQFDGLSAADRATVRDFIDLQKGQFDKSWTFPFDGTNYAACQFEMDELSATEAETAIGRYGFSLKIRQVKKHASLRLSAPAFP